MKTAHGDVVHRDRPGSIRDKFTRKFVTSKMLRAE